MTLSNERSELKIFCHAAFSDLAVFMQPRCCLVAVKRSPIKFEDCAKSDFRVPPDTEELDRGGAEILSALTAGWPPCNQKYYKLF